MSTLEAVKTWFFGIGTPTDKELVILSPFHLYKKYRQFPLSIILHFFIVIFLSVQAILISNETIGYGRANERSFEANFLPVGLREKGVYDIITTVDLISDIVTNYYTFPVISVGRYAHMLNEDGDATTISPIILSLTQYKNLTGSFWKLPCPTNSENYNITFSSEFIEDFTSFTRSQIIDNYNSISDFWGNISENDVTIEDIDGDFDLITTEYNLTLDDKLGPFSKSLSSCELQSLFYSIKEMSLSFTFKSVNIGNIAVLPYYWDIEIYLPLVAGQISPKIIISHRVISISNNAPSIILIVLNAILFIASFLSGMLSMNSVRRNAQVFLRTKAKYGYFNRVSRPGDLYPTWSSIPWKVKILFFDLWSLFNAIGCTIIMIACLIGLLEEYGKDTTASYMALYGLGCMLACLNLIRYFEYFPSLYLHVLTLRNAAWHVITYCISVLPIYWAFAIFGVLNYGPYSEKFNSIGHTLVTLFSLLNGDDIYATFMEIEDGQYPLTFVSRIYLFCFVTLFITSVLNVFIFIIEDSYRTAKLVTRSPEENVDEGHQSLHKTSKSSTEILERIFYNLEIWQDRLEHHSLFDFDELQFKSINHNQNEGGDDENDENNDNNDAASTLLPHKKTNTNYRKFSLKDRHSMHDHPLPVKEQFREFSTAVYDDDAFFHSPQNKSQSHNQSIKLQELSPRNTNNNNNNNDDDNNNNEINYFDNDLFTRPSSMNDNNNDGKTDQFSFLDKLQNQILAQKKQYELEIEKRDKEFRQMKDFYEDQNNNLLNICQMLRNSLQETKKP